ncbi:hypothetical protein E4T39_00354 [Aureobasidium subglaciale]|nr:hypothetical protein E4T39_00354 [Aureobasidium subglaciale]
MARPTHSALLSLPTTSRGKSQSDNESGDNMQDRSTHAEADTHRGSDPNDSWWNGSASDTRAACDAIENDSPPVFKDELNHEDKLNPPTEMSRSVVDVNVSSEEGTKDIVNAQASAKNHQERHKSESGSSYSPSQKGSHSSGDAPDTKAPADTSRVKQERNGSYPSTNHHKKVQDTISHGDARVSSPEDTSSSLDRRFQSLRKGQDKGQRSDNVAPAFVESNLRQTLSSQRTQSDELRNAPATSGSTLLRNHPMRFSKKVTQLSITSQYSRGTEPTGTLLPASMMSLTDTWPHHTQMSPRDEEYHEIPQGHGPNSEDELTCGTCGELQPAVKIQLASAVHPTCPKCNTTLAQKQDLTKPRKDSSLSSKRKEPQFITYKSILKSMRNPPNIPTPVPKLETTQPIVRFAPEGKQATINAPPSKSIEVVEALPFTSEDLPGNLPSDLIKLGVKTMPGQSPIWIQVSRDAPLGELFVAALQVDDALRGYVFMLPDRFVRWDDTPDELDLKRDDCFEMHELPETWLSRANSEADAAITQVAAQSSASKQILDSDKVLGTNHTLETSKAISTREACHAGQRSPTAFYVKVSPVTRTAKAFGTARITRSKTLTTPQNSVSEKNNSLNNAAESESGAKHDPSTEWLNVPTRQESEDPTAATIKQLSTLGQSVMESMKRGIKRVLSEERAFKAGEKKRLKQG